MFDSGGVRTNADSTGRWKSLDWYYALNHFQRRGAGSLQTTHGFTYKLEVRERYDGGVPSEHRKDLERSIGRIDYHISQPEIAHPHTIGLARDFDVRTRKDLSSGRSAARQYHECTPPYRAALAGRGDTGPPAVGKGLSGLRTRRSWRRACWSCHFSC